MGRSVSSPRNATTVCFRDISSFGEVYDEENNLTEEYDECQSAYDWECFVEMLQEDAKAKWPSFDATDEWVGREDHAILENNFAYIGVSEYCGLVSIWLLPKTEDLLNTGYDADVKMANLASAWCNRVSGNFETLFAEYRKVATASNGEAFYEKVQKAA
jgi:hypothetical protein